MPSVALAALALGAVFVPAAPGASPLDLARVERARVLQAAAAWRLTRDARCAEHAARHLRAWFLDEATRMSPQLRFAQAISGRVSGCGIGIIDTLQLVEVARAIEALAVAPGLLPAERRGVRDWFAAYVEWLTTHAYGIAERDTKNNHASCWVLQVAAFARLAGREDLVQFCRERFKAVLLAERMAPDGSFPQETRRTKPYAYSLFNLEALAGIAQLLSTPADELWHFTLPDGRGLSRAWPSWSRSCAIEAAGRIRRT